MSQIYPPIIEPATEEPQQTLRVSDAIAALIWLAFFAALLVAPAAVWAAWKVLL